MSHSSLEETIASHETPGTKFYQPFAVTPELEAEADERISHYQDSKRSATLPLLHIVQHKFGYISADSIEWVARKLELEPIKVLEVVTFYPGFRQSAPGKFHIRVCRTLSCAMGGSYELMEKLCELTGIDRSNSDSHHHPISVSPCGRFSVEFAECLASCGTAPVCMVNDDFHEGISSEHAEALLKKYSEEELAER
ncbi:MAG: NAD(P)H-dependent oxidoreductase subunit E [Luteolibacter sp.]